MFLQNTLEAAENLIKRHEAFITTMDANDEKINAVLQFANRLIEDNHYAADKVHNKAENINERYSTCSCFEYWEYWMSHCYELHTILNFIVVHLVFFSFIMSGVL